MFWGSHNPQNKNTGKLDKKENLENKSKRMYPTVKGGPASKQVMAKRKIESNQKSMKIKLNCQRVFSLAVASSCLFKQRDNPCGMLEEHEKSL